MKSLETGVDIIDSQHKQLMQCVDELLEAGMQQKSREKIKDTLDFLGRYVVEHFAAEEHLMITSGYPKYALHKNHHDSYIQTFKGLKKRYETEGETLDIVLSVNKNVVEWLTNHINVQDMEFAKYYRTCTVPSKR